MLGSVKGAKIYVGLSGGVDSAVSAALLRQQGARVVGVFIKGWYPPGLPCTWAEDRRDAMRVAAHLHIPFITLDASAEYKKSVIDYLLSEYKEGRTPNPDVMCNKDIKFGVFYGFAKQRGADAIATGHYRAGDKNQTYFLWAVPKEVLSQTLFPVGNLDKQEVRKLAARLGLPVARKKDSQGVCFLGSVSVKEFLEHELGSNAAILHTIGERIDGRYVVGKDVEAGTLQLAREPKTPGRDIRFRDAQWHGAPAAATTAQTRYRGEYLRGRIEGDAFFADAVPREMPTPGQSIVFYNQEELVGGGIIV